jgi:hypothetical protein
MFSILYTLLFIFTVAILLHTGLQVCHTFACIWGQGSFAEILHECSARAELTNPAIGPKGQQHSWVVTVLLLEYIPTILHQPVFQEGFVSMSHRGMHLGTSARSAHEMFRHNVDQGNLDNWQQSKLSTVHGDGWQDWVTPVS